jgi:CheY-like chemotaxis protein
MDSPTQVPRRIIVADEDRAVVAFIVRTLRDDGYEVFQAYDMLAATQLSVALNPCDLVMSDSRVEGADGIQLITELRQRLPTLPIIYLANLGRSTPELERQLPPDVAILREPFTPEKLRWAVTKMFNGRAR